MYVPTLSGLLGVNENLPPTKRLGGSIQYQFPIYKTIRMSINYSHVNARFSSGPNRGKRIPFVAANKATVHFSYRFLSRWTLRMEAILLGDRFPEGDVTNQGALLKGYGIVNIALRYKYKHISIIATINNPTNARYNNFAQVVQSGSGVQTFYYPAPRRNFWLSIKVDI